MSDIFDHEMDAWASIDDYLNDGAGPNWPEPKTCKHCGVGGLHWGSATGAWRLYTPGHKLHLCPPQNNFEDLTCDSPHTPTSARP